MASRAAVPTNIKEIYKEAIRQGWRIEQGRNCHYKFFAPAPSKEIVVVSHSPRAMETIRKVVCQLRKAGLDI